MAAVVLAGLVLVPYASVVAHLDDCLVDYATLRGGKLGKLELPDARLNAWILAWVQHSLLEAPSGLLDANIFYPARATLTQSEHMVATAVMLLPLRAFTANAVALHQSAIVLSTWLLGLCTWALVRWLTRSEAAALLAGAAAAFMPWRLSELSHVQLLSAQWFPLVWLGLGRVVCDGPTRGRVAVLGLALTAQVLSSFYLAYYLLVSCAALGVALWAVVGLDRRRVLALAAAGAPAAIALGLAGLPYLRWSRGEGFRALAVLFDSVRPADALSVTLPVWTLGWRDALPRAVTYEIPLVVFALGVLGAAGGVRARGAGDAPRRAFAWGLLGACAASFALLLGRELDVGGLHIPLPAAFAARWVPGFENLRNPLRWAIVIGLAFPVLAGLGIADVLRAVASRRGAVWRTGAVAAIAIALASSLPLPRIPVAPAWEAERAPLYARLAELPFGPVLEVPWPLQPQHDIDLASRYMLASTTHWRPLTNGTSGYVPASYTLLRQIAQGLPRPAAQAALSRLADVRWIVVHRDLLGSRERAAWRSAAASGALRRVYEDPLGWIFEVPDRPGDGALSRRLVDPTPREKTLTGLSRAPLAPGPDGGSLRARVATPFRYLGARRVPKLVPVEVANRSDRPWPGLDVQPEGLVRVRYAFRDASGGAVAEEVAAQDVAPLAADVPAGATLATRVPLRPPARRGRYRLRLELVQHRDGAEHPLGIPPFETIVTVLPGSGAVDDYEPSPRE